MNKFICILFFSLFLVVPPSALVLRWIRRRFMPWWFLFVLVFVFSWIFVNGTVYFYYAHLGDVLNTYGGNPPADFIEKLTNDGAKKVFALFFGWLYGLIYFSPWLMLYGVFQFIRRNKIQKQFPQQYA